MVLAIIICAVCCVLMIFSILFFPRIKLGKVTIATYWPITLLGAVLVLACGCADFKTVGEALIQDTAINPLKILVLFLSMTILSVYLDELGFFRYLASAILKRAKTGQTKLFLYLYLLVSVLTVFTSNDIIILSFTPFICYFAKNAKINPLPYLVAEFVAANTWSMALVIGNPTNIYLATAYGIDFVSYLKMSLLPTLAAGVTAFAVLYLLFRKELKQPMTGEAEEVELPDKPALILGGVHLGACTVLLAVSSYLGIEMWIVSLAAVGSLFLCTGILALIRKKKPMQLLGCVKRTPYALIPFVLSMFIMIVALDKNGVTKAVAEFFGASLPVLKYGTTSFLTANLINNIPMSVFFTSVLQYTDGALTAVFATIIGSNLGALLTPIGSLAGIMWNNILSKHEVKFSYVSFLKVGIAVSLPTLFAALGTLALLPWV